MKIGYFADGPWSHRAYERIKKDSRFEFCFICVWFDSEDKILEEIGRADNIPILRECNVNSGGFVELVQSFQCDILVSMSFNQIFKKSLIGLAPKKLINCHAGKLPFYRGRNVLNWALINDEKDFGVTVHYVDKGIDTGDIILQNVYPINDHDDYHTLLERAYDYCAETLHEALVKIEAGSVVPVPQGSIHPIGMYCGMRQQGDEVLSWNQTSREVFNFVRAICKPGPMARSFFKQGEELKLNKVRMVSGAPSYKGTPGQVLGKTPDGFIVKTKDTFVEITEYVSEKKIKVGDRLDGKNCCNCGGGSQS